MPLQTPSALRSPLFDEVRQSGVSDVRVVVLPGASGSRSVALGCRSAMPDGSFAGVAAVIIESTRLADVARRA